MLFLWKRRWPTAVAALVGLTAVGLTLRHLRPDVPPFDLTGQTVLLGVAVFGVVLISDATLHGLFCVLFGAPYRRRHRELVLAFQGQGVAAMLAGALMAGVGEELVFRGLNGGWVYLSVSAVVFGLLHHFRARLWPFTAWAVYQGLLFALALYLTQALAVTMTAHFLHDLAGFLLFAHLRRRPGFQADA
jgi:membrane protease YdiL (CAAX protease family)